MKIVNMRALCSASKTLAPIGYLPHYILQVNLDISNGRLCWAYVTENSYVQYDDPNMIFVCYIYHPATMAEIRDMVLGSDGVRGITDENSL